jgi:hypothetical protein
MPTQALARLTLIFAQHHAQPPVTHHLTYAIILLISYLLLLIADITENPSELIYHSYWLLIYSISTCTPIRLLINSSLVDYHSIVLPIVPYRSYWTIAISTYKLIATSSTYISTCTYARDGQLLSWSNLLASFESHQTLTLPSRSLLVNLTTFIVCFTSKSETEDQGRPPPFASS